MAVIQEYLSKGYIRLIDDEPEPGKGFLPHFPIVKPSSTKTKTRIVFDASAKVEGVSLDDAIHTGPKLQGDLFEILVRFRKESVALVCDITQMYLQIELPEHDRPYHRFLWRDLDQSAPPQIYEFNRVVFGINASPFLAQFVSQEHARQHAAQYPLAAEVVLKSTFMDDGVTSVIDEDTGKETYHQLSQLWESAGMHARKWLSNSHAVLEEIPVADQAPDIDLSGDLPAIKSLGLKWQASNDTLSFNIRAEQQESPWTKRLF